MPTPNADKEGGPIPVEPYERFRAAVAVDAATVRLDEAALAVAAGLQPDLDVDGYLARLDALAAACPAPTLDALLAHLFGPGRFAGNTEDYYDPRNSLLSDVLDRRTGIPITLCILAMEVGRRIGVPMSGVGMPGHFLLRDKVDPSVFADPFHGGRQLDATGCRSLYERLGGDRAAWSDAYLAPVSRHAVVTRMLTNLQVIYQRDTDLQGLQWIVRLRLAVPGLGLEEASSLRTLLAPLN